MAGLILCRTRYAERPYYINNMGVNIYSLEELCYYIYNNIYLIGTDLFDEGLTDYISGELGEKELAEQLEFLITENAGLSELVMTVLRYVDYYSEEEIDALAGTIESLDTQNASERLKLRADNFLSNKRYSNAVHNYEIIVYGQKDINLSDDFYGNVWHNMGVAYAGMFEFGDAVQCFKRAYALNSNDESLKASFAAEYLSGSRRPADSEDEQSYAAYREIETIMDHAPEEAGYEAVKKAFELRDNGQADEYNAAVNDIIDNWKFEYRNYISAAR